VAVTVAVIVAANVAVAAHGNVAANVAVAVFGNPWPMWSIAAECSISKNSTYLRATLLIERIVSMLTRLIDP